MSEKDDAFVKKVVDNFQAIDTNMIKATEYFVGRINKPLARALVTVDRNCKNLAFGFPSKAIKSVFPNLGKTEKSDYK